MPTALQQYSNCVDPRPAAFSASGILERTNPVNTYEIKIFCPATFFPVIVKSSSRKGSTPLPTCLRARWIAKADVASLNRGNQPESVDPPHSGGFFYGRNANCCRQDPRLQGIRLPHRFHRSSHCFVTRLALSANGATVRLAWRELRRIHHSLQPPRRAALNR